MRATSIKKVCAIANIATRLVEFLVRVNPNVLAGKTACSRHPNVDIGFCKFLSKQGIEPGSLTLQFHSSFASEVEALAYLDRSADSFFCQSTGAHKEARSHQHLFERPQRAGNSRLLPKATPF